MARLTYKNGFNQWVFLIVGREFSGKVADKLAQYENMGDPSELQPIKRGEWIKGEGEFAGYAICSNCRKCGVDPDWIEKETGGKFKFCPECGADMRSDEERTVANDR